LGPAPAKFFQVSFAPESSIIRRMKVMEDLSPHRLSKYVRIWTIEDIRLLRELAEMGCAVATIATRLRRTAKSIRRRAQMHGISLRGCEERSR
jgi:hypothetical protein